MSRILFVDDEPRILDGLRRMLRAQRQEWEMVFALGGSAALDELRSARFDAVVTDMRMPGTDGLELLSAACELQPWALRFVLSGHTDSLVAARAACVAHQFLAKPCNPEVVRGQLGAALVHADGVPASIRSLVGSINSFPVRPESLARLQTLLLESEPSPDSLVAAADREPGLRSKLLQVVSSSFFGMPRPGASLETAVRLLGPAHVRNLVNAAGAFYPLPRATEPRGTETAAATDGVSPLGAMILAAVCEPIGEAAAICQGEAPRQRRASEGLSANAEMIGRYQLGIWNVLVPAAAEGAAAVANSR